MGMSEFYGDGDDEESIATIHRALDAGLSFLDTAAMYGAGDERARWSAAPSRTAATRSCSPPSSASCAIRRTPWPGDRRPARVRQASPATSRSARLGLDHIDLFYQHRVDPEVPIEETVGAMARAGRGGQGAPPRPVRGSARTRSGARTARTRSPRSRPSTRCGPATWRRRSSRRCASWASASWPTARSAAASSPARFQSPDDFEEDDFRRNNPRFQGENFDRNLELVDRVEELAEREGRAPPASSRSPGCWRRATTSCRSPAPSAVRYLEENVGARRDRALRRRPAAPRRGRAPWRRRGHALPRGADVDRQSLIEVITAAKSSPPWPASSAAA